MIQGQRFVMPPASHAGRLMAGQKAVSHVAGHLPGRGPYSGRAPRLGGSIPACRSTWSTKFALALV